MIDSIRQFVAFRNPKLLPHAHGPKSVFPTPRLSSLVVAMCNFAFWVLGESYLNDFHERFLLMNKVGLAFEMLCSIKKAHRCID